MKVIDGQTLKGMLISASNNLYNHYPEVDALNVFPVPDGDTGMNMNLTMTSGAKEIQNRGENSCSEIAKSFSRGLLMGARGNSGVITSQIFRGFYQGLDGKAEISAKDFAAAMQKGVEVAYKAVIKPVEGTILTVVREASQYLFDHVQDGMSLSKAIRLFLDEAYDSLNRTPELLPILKEVGVVDSGGAGLIKIFEGMESALTGNPVERNQATATEDNPLIAAGSKMENEEFGYCTEFIMSLGPDTVKKPFDEKRFTNHLLARGNSLVVVRDEDIVKVHVHTLNPGNVLNYGQQFGEFLKIKIENMTEQHHALETGALKQEDVTPDLVEEEDNAPLNPFALIAVSSGPGIEKHFKELGVDEIVKGGQTMNPSAEDFVEAIKKVHAQTVYIFPNNSNILMAAAQAADVIEDKSINVYVIPTKTIPQGMTAVMTFNPEESAEDNFKAMKSALKNVKSGEVTFAIRDTEMNGISVKKDDYIAISGKQIISAHSNKFDALMSLLETMVSDENYLISILVGADVDEKEKEQLKAKINELYGDLDCEIIDGGQPVYSFIVGIE